MDKQITGNVGLYYTCYMLSRKGWNVMPTARNARGVDIVAYSQDGSRRFLIQVKALNKPNAVAMGQTAKNGTEADFWVIVTKAQETPPDVFVLASKQIEALAYKEKDGSRWLPYKSYATDEFRERWDRIGEGK
jgi:hypothetical protein